jgi:hypothetical protein
MPPSWVWQPVAKAKPPAMSKPAITRQLRLFIPNSYLGFQITDVRLQNESRLTPILHS